MRFDCFPFQKNTTLKYLRMTGNKVENEGGMFFAAMLQINSSLEKLDLGDCDLVSKLVMRRSPSNGSFSLGTGIETSYMT